MLCCDILLCDDQHRWGQVFNFTERIRIDDVIPAVIEFEPQQAKLRHNHILLRQ
jgi:hypothetical protein